MEANESHKSEDAFLNEVQRRFQVAASKPEGPAAPSILRTVLRISCPSILSKRIRWGSTRGVSGVIMDVCIGGCFVAGFCKRTSRTVSGIVMELLDAIRESKFSGPPPSLSATSRSAVLTLPSIISLANVRAFCSADLA